MHFFLVGIFLQVSNEIIFASFSFNLSSSSACFFRMVYNSENCAQTKCTFSLFTCVQKRSNYQLNQFPTPFFLKTFQKEITRIQTSFFAFVRASSSDDIGIALDDSDAYRFTTDILSITDDVLPHSPNTVSSFFRMNDGGAPKSGPIL